VVLDPAWPVEGLADSKLLSERRRMALSDAIRTRALAWAVACASVEEVDQMNILRASLLAMQRAIGQLQVTPTEVLVDGQHCPRIQIPVRAVVGGDATVAVISAASILAKTGRDAEMLRLHGRFPEYGFDRHKGYPTPEHLAALHQHGVCEIHRRSFAPVKKLILAGG
jgi:ribonuclease HII